MSPSDENQRDRLRLVHVCVKDYERESCLTWMNKGCKAEAEECEGQTASEE